MDIDILETSAVGLSELSDVVKNEVCKKIVYDDFAEKVNSIDTSGLVKQQIMTIISLILNVKYLVSQALLLLLLMFLRIRYSTL